MYLNFRMEKSEDKDDGFYIAWERMGKIIFTYGERVAKEIFENFPC